MKFVVGVLGAVASAAVLWGLAQLNANMVWASDLKDVVDTQQEQAGTLVNVQLILLRSEIRDISAELRALEGAKPLDGAELRLERMLTEDLQQAQDQMDALMGIPH